MLLTGTPSVLPPPPIPLPHDPGGPSKPRKKPNRKRPSVLTDEPPFFVLKANYRLSEVAEILNVGRDTVDRFVREGFFPNAIVKRSQKKGYRVYSLTRIPRGDLLSFIEEHRWSVRRRR